MDVSRHLKHQVGAITMCSCVHALLMFLFSALPSSIHFSSGTRKLVLVPADSDLGRWLNAGPVPAKELTAEQEDELGLYRIQSQGVTDDCAAKPPSILVCHSLVCEKYAARVPVTSMRQVCNTSL